MYESIETRKENGETRHYLAGRRICAGDVIEVEMTDGEWVRARFERGSRFCECGYQISIYIERGPRPEIARDAPCRWPEQRLLTSQSGETLHLSGDDWNQLVQLARIGGLSIPQDADVLSGAEASALASALESMLPDVPDHNLRHGIPTQPDTPLEWFSGERKQILEKFITFGRSGAFFMK